MILQADSLKSMREMPESSVDAIVTDPPYGLEFMGKDWDKFRVDPRVARWSAGGAGFAMSSLGCVLPSWHKRRTTSECKTCGKRDAFRNPHACDPNADWHKIHVDNVAIEARAFQFWCEGWAIEACRVLKPGGHLLAFGGTRTFHRLTCALEDAGFDIRDCVMWLYGSGFPKSLDVSKALDKANGAEREAVKTPRAPNALGTFCGSTDTRPWIQQAVVRGFHQHARPVPVTDVARAWEGWGTALKPAWEPIIVARKPLAGGTVAENVQAHGTGALNVDGCRLPVDPNDPVNTAVWTSRPSAFGMLDMNEPGTAKPKGGRWPANVVLAHTPECREVGTRRIKGHHEKSKPYVPNHANKVYGRGKGGGAHPGFANAEGVETVAAWECAPECPVRLLDEQSGETAAKPGRIARKGGNAGALGSFAGSTPNAIDTWPADAGGGASRFFYTAKASRSEREPVGGKEPGGTVRRAYNDHPTVKPVALMRWLVRLVTPPGGTVLDPFLGSGSTALACAAEGFQFIGLELDDHYVKVAEKRLFWRNTKASKTTKKRA